MVTALQLMMPEPACYSFMLLGNAQHMPKQRTDYATIADLVKKTRRNLPIMISSPFFNWA